MSEQRVRAALVSPDGRLLPAPAAPHRRGVSVDPLDYIARTPDGEPVIIQGPVCDLDT